MSRPLIWVVGSGGLLGSNVAHAIGLWGQVWRPARRLDWSADSAEDELAAAVAEFAAIAKRGRWQVAWCAGAGVTGSAVDVLARETALFDVLLDALARTMPRRADSGLFLASSAGGVYAGSTGPPFTEQTPVRPISAYGEAKLRMENAATHWGAAHGWHVLIGRIANLYGPGQDMSKHQGLISALCRSHLRREPLAIYVPLDTIRDYLYAADCGGLVADGLARICAEAIADGPIAQVKILASGQAVTIAELIDEFRHAVGTAPPIAATTSPTARFQAKDLRLRSVVWPELEERTFTPLEVGIRMTFDHLSRVTDVER